MIIIQLVVSTQLELIVLITTVRIILIVNDHMNASIGRLIIHLTTFKEGHLIVYVTRYLI